MLRPDDLLPSGLTPATRALRHSIGCRSLIVSRSGGVTPITVAASLPSRIVRPTMFRSPENLVRHSRSERTATTGAPGLHSSTPNARPSCIFTPSIGKKSSPTI